MQNNLLGVFNQSLWLDEATSVVKASTLSFKDLILTFSVGDFHPPLYYLTLKLWISIFGNSEVSVRSLSVLFSALSVWCLYLIGKKLFNRFVGIASAGLLATGPLFFYYAHEARMYAMSTFFTILVILCFVNILQSKKPNIFNWTSFVAAAVLLIYTDYLPAITLLFCVAFLLLEKKNFQAYKGSWLISFAAIAVSFVPWIPIFRQQLEVGALVKENAPIWWETLGRINLKQIALVPVKFLIGRISFQDKVVYASIVLLYAFEFGISAFYSLKKFKESRFIWLWFSIPLAVALVFGLIMSGFSYFRLLFLLPPFYLLVAHGLSMSEKSRAGKLYFRIGLNMLAVLIFIANPRFWREDWKGTVSWLESDSGNANSASIFVTNNQRDPYVYYSKNIPAYGPDGLNTGNFERIYLFRYVQPIFDPQDNVRKTVENAGYIKVEERDFNGVTVWKYTNESRN